MSRLARLLLPLSLSVVSTGAIVMACHHGDAPSAPRPEPTDPSGKPMTGAAPAMGSPAMEAPMDAGVDSMLGTPQASAAGPSLSGAHAARSGGAEAVMLLASQPASPAAPPAGAPAPAPTPSVPAAPPVGAPPPASPPQPGTPPTTGAPPPSPPPPGTPPTTGAPPPSPPQPPSPSPSAPAPGSPSAPRPGTGSGSGSGSASPGPSAGPTDAGVSDAGLPRLPPVPDAGMPGDAGLQPILRRN